MKISMFHNFKGSYNVDIYNITEDFILRNHYGDLKKGRCDERNEQGVIQKEKSRQGITNLKTALVQLVLKL